MKMKKRDARTTGGVGKDRAFCDHDRAVVDNISHPDVDTHARVFSTPLGFLSSDCGVLLTTTRVVIGVLDHSFIITRTGIALFLFTISSHTVFVVLVRFRDVRFI